VESVSFTEPTAISLVAMLAPPPAPGTPSGDFLNQVMPQVSPAMLNYGVETTSNLLKTQRDLYMPGVSHFWNSLKIYFMVFFSCSLLAFS
jgi:hypothetical protein